jgi:hypothetical protein
MPDDALAKVLADDALSESEQKYFDTAGQDTSGLLSDDAARSSEPTSRSAEPTEARSASDTASATPPKPTASRDDATAAELAKERDLRVRTEERLNMLVEALTPAQRAEERQEVREDPRPDPEKDVFAYMRWQERRAERLEQTVHARAQQDDARRSERQFIGTYHNDARNFARSNPDFAQAYQFILADRDRELQQMGYGDASERSRIILGEERDLVLRNLQAGKSPSQAVYNLAKGRGFKGAASTAGQSRGGASRPSGGSSEAIPSLEALGEMSDDDFAAVVAKYGGLDQIVNKGA